MPMLFVVARNFDLCKASFYFGFILVFMVEFNIALLVNPDLDSGLLPTAWQSLGKFASLSTSGLALHALACTKVPYSGGSWGIVDR